MPRSLVVVIVLSTALAPGCATLGQQCATSLLEVTAQVCVDILCDEGEDGELVDDDEPRARPRAEPPPPDWRPSEGACDITYSDDGVRVACADGTRALFGPAGEGGPPLLEEAAPDDACSDGSVVRQGVDADGSGTLSSAEVTGRTLDCARGPTLQGHLAIHGPGDVARLAGRRALTGGLHIQSPGLIRLELPQLQSLGAALRVEQSPALEVLLLPSLASVGGDVVVARAPRLQTLHAAALVRVGGSFIAVDNPQLPQRDVEELVFRLSRHGFAGPVELAGNRP